MPTRIEFWPDYGAESPLWLDGNEVDLKTLPLQAEVEQRLRAFAAAYQEDRIPGEEGDGDPRYLAEGAELLAVIRDQLGAEYEVIVTEDWWGEPGADV